MENNTQTVEDLLSEAYHLPNGDRKVELVEKAVQLADSQNNLEDAFEARLALMQAGCFSGYPEKMMVAMAWCLAKCDAEPERFKESDVLWQYKWVLGSAIGDFPQISIEKINAMLDDFELRAKRNNQGARAGLLYRYRLAKALEQDSVAVDYFTRWAESPRDELSNCKACEADEVVSEKYRIGQLAEGLQKAEALINSSDTCNAVPHRTLANALIYLLKTGDLDKAKDYHARGYRMCKNDIDYVGNMGDHMSFLALTGNFDRAQKVLSDNIGHVFKTHELGSKFEFWLGALSMLDVLERNQIMELALPAPKEAPFWHKDGQYRIAQLRFWVENELYNIAQQFDTRNGNKRYQKRIQEALELHQHFVQSPIADTAVKTRRATPGVKRMEPIIDLVSEFLTRQEWGFDRSENNDAIFTGVSGEHGQYNISFICFEELEQLLVITYAPDACPAERIPAMAELVARLNYNMRLGNFELNVDDGGVRFRTSVDIEGGILSEVMIGNLLGTSMRTLDNFYPVIKDVISGTSPTEALEKQNAE